MQWIDEMFASMKKNRDAASAQRSAENSRGVDAFEKADQPISSTSEAWEDLLSVLRHDVNEFNNHPSRAGRTPVLMTDQTFSLRHFQFEVYLPEMHSKLLVLTLEKNRLHVLVRPDFPPQRSTIILEAAPNSPPYCWVLGEANEARTTITVPQLSEYLLKPILSAAEMD